MIEVPMTYDRATKNTYVFQAEGEDYPIRTLYVNKDGFPSGPPSAITVTVTEVEDAE